MLADVFVKSTDTNQYLHAASCHVYHSKKFTPYSQALRFNRICSKNQSFDKRCNDLEVWLKNHGYNENLVTQQILKARKRRRTELLYSERERKFIKISWCLYITDYPIFSKLKNTFSKIHLFLTSDR